MDHAATDAHRAADAGIGRVFAYHNGRVLSMDENEARWWMRMPRRADGNGVDNLFLASESGISVAFVEANGARDVTGAPVRPSSARRNINV